MSRLTRHVALRLRRGFSLPVVLFALILLALLIAGVSSASTQDYRVSRNAVIEQRAFGVAESGLNTALATWGPGGSTTAPNLANNGDTVQLAVTTGMGDAAAVTLTRLTPNTYWLTSSGAAGSSTGLATGRAERQVSMALRYAKPDVQIRGALTSYGGITVKGNATVSGQNVDPSGWTAECASYPGTDTAAISYAPGANVTVQKASGVNGSVYSDPVAGNLNTYDQFGSQNWASLTAGADIILPGDVNPYPAGTNTACDRSGANATTNWGEPQRTSPYQGCKNYFPVIYSPRDLHLNGNARGQGILLVDGDLQINGTFDFYGIIIVRGELDVNGTGDIWGTVLARSAKLTDTNLIFGAADIHYSACAAQRAMNASAVLMPTSKRSWAPLN